MRARSIILLSSASALALPSAALACDLEGPGSRFSAFAHLVVQDPPAQSDASASVPAPQPVTYKDDSRDPKSVEPAPTDYNKPAETPSGSGAEPAGEAITR